MTTNKELMALKEEISEVKSMLKEHLTVANVIDGNLKEKVKSLFIKFEKFITKVDGNISTTAALRTRVAVLENENKLDKEVWKTVIAWVMAITTVLTLAVLVVQKLLP